MRSRTSGARRSRLARRCACSSARYTAPLATARCSKLLSPLTTTRLRDNNSANASVLNRPSARHTALPSGSATSSHTSALREEPVAAARTPETASDRLANCVNRGAGQRCEGRFVFGFSTTVALAAGRSGAARTRHRRPQHLDRGRAKSETRSKLDRPRPVADVRDKDARAAGSVRCPGVARAPGLRSTACTSAIPAVGNRYRIPATFPVREGSRCVVAASTTVPADHSATGLESERQSAKGRGAIAAPRRTKPPSVRRSQPDHLVEPRLAAQQVGVVRIDRPNQVCSRPRTARRAAAGRACECHPGRSIAQADTIGHGSINQAGTGRDIILACLRSPDRYCSLWQPGQDCYRGRIRRLEFDP